MAFDADGWVKIAESPAHIAFGANGIAEVAVQGKIICLAVWRADVIAFAPKCPHAGGRFADGFVDVLGNVVCPLHRYKFCLVNGRNISGEGYYLKRWPVAQRSTGLFVQLGNEPWLPQF